MGLGDVENPGRAAPDPSLPGPSKKKNTSGRFTRILLRIQAAFRRARRPYSGARAVRELGFPRRILLRGPRLFRPVGRPLSVLDPESQSLLNDLLRTTGPNLGLPTLRSMMPWAPRAALRRELRFYRALYRRKRSSMIYRLKWKRARAVWAADLSEAPADVDQGAQVFLAVRDLASGYTVAWHPLRSGSGEDVEWALRVLFKAHGAPLVLKTDNGSCFISKAVASLLEEFEVAHLRSPRAWPQYNGACEAGVGALRTLTETARVELGEAGEWSFEACCAARQILNERRRRKRRGPEARWRLPWPRRRACRREFQTRLEARWEKLRRKHGKRREPRLWVRRKAIEDTLRSAGYLRLEQHEIRSRALTRRELPRLESLEVISTVQ